MRLRKLIPADAPLMLEWMHDADVVSYLGANFAEKKLEDCQRFIADSQTDPENLHLAVVDEDDTYMGTVSLKHIDRTSKTAEFAVTVRASAMGRGFSRFGMERILTHGIQDLGLSAIYWCVSPKNERAIRFYNKCGYQRTDRVPEALLGRYAGMELVWYIYP